MDEPGKLHLSQGVQWETAAGIILGAAECVGKPPINPKTNQTKTHPSSSWNQEILQQAKQVCCG